jgi:dihydroorotate dehydrogenase
MSRKNKLLKKETIKKGKGIRQQVNRIDGTIRLIDYKGNIQKLLPPATSKREIRQHIKKINSNINSPNKTKKGFLRKFLKKIFKKKSRKKSTPILVKMQNSFNDDIKDYSKLRIKQTGFR